MSSFYEIHKMNSLWSCHVYSYAYFTSETTLLISIKFVTGGLHYKLSDVFNLGHIGAIHRMGSFQDSCRLVSNAVLLLVFPSFQFQLDNLCMRRH